MLWLFSQNRSGIRGYDFCKNQKKSNQWPLILLTGSSHTHTHTPLTVCFARPSHVLTSRSQQVPPAVSRLRLIHLICKQWWTTTSPTFRATLSTLLCSCEPLSLLGALISTDVLCFSVATSNMRSSYLQFIACPLPVLPNSEDFPPPQISVSVGA